MKVERVTFDDILPIWRDRLWPGRKSAIEPVSSMAYLGGYDITIKNNEASFFAVCKGGEIVGVNSGFPTGDDQYRSRGIWVDPELRGKDIGRMLIEAVVKDGMTRGCVMVWTVPRKSAMPFYERCGFKRVSDWFAEGMEFGPNCYAARLV